MKAKIFLFASLVALASCTQDFEEINTNTNQPETVIPDMILPYLIYSGVDTGPLGSIVTQHFAVRDWQVGLGRYDWWSTPYWDYSLLRNVNNMIMEAEKLEHDNFKGIALIFKAYLFSRTTDAVGDIPYSEALKGKEGEYTPVYDTQESVYTNLLAELETANSLLDVKGAALGGDILYDGNILKWKKFANSLQLRLLMRVSDKKTDARAKIKTIVDNPSKYPIFESNDDMAALTYLADAPNRYPNYNATGYDAGEVVLGKPLVDTMTIYNDPRLPVIARPTAASVDAGNPMYAGVPCGMSKEEAIAYNGGIENQSLVSQRYNRQPNTEKGIYMAYSELQFILAEAAQKGWIGGSAETYYLNGIRGSFEYYGVADQYSAYVAGPSVKFNAANSLLQIGVQKWMAFFFNNGYEVFFDWRRTHIPALDPGKGNLNGGKIPVRWKYPDSEQNFNNENYKAALDRQGADNTNTPIWLTK